MRQFGAAILAFSAVTAWAHAQDWAQVHREDEAKWARASGLTPFAVHRLWRMASLFADENDDDARIQNLDVLALADRKQVLLVTSSGDPNCLLVTVFATNPYRKVWSEQQTPSGEGYCDNRFGEAAVRVVDGLLEIRIPEGPDKNDPSQLSEVIYQYGWQKNTYKFVGNRRTIVRPKTRSQ